MDKKLDKIAEDISEIKTTLAEQHVVLKEHIRRTEILESEVRPIKAPVAKVEGIVKAIILVATVAAAIGAFHK